MVKFVVTSNVSVFNVSTPRHIVSSEQSCDIGNKLTLVNAHKVVMLQ
jgi:hypothetical protein